MRLAPTLVAAPCLCLLAGCGDLLDLRVQTEALCLPVAMQSFAGATAPSGPLPLAGTSSKSVVFDFTKPLDQIPGEQAGLKLDARLDQVFVRSTGDLSFVKRVKVTLAPGTPNDMLPPVPIGEYERPAPTGMPIREIKVQSTHNANVIKYLADEPARLIFTATGRLPTDPFTADVEACIFVQGQATY